MLIPLNELVDKYNIIFKGILHVGAHECEELIAYEKYISRNKILWIEALKEKVELSKNRYPNLLIEQAVISDKIETVTFYKSNNGQSSSILKLGLHKNFYPNIFYVDSFETESKLLKDILPNYDISYNFLNFDIQGAELKALKSMEDYLKNIDYIYIEVNSDYVYEECCLINEIDEYLLNYGLKRVQTEWAGGDCKWGDAFYIRTNIYIC
jgi:FkbM family methyltransferase